MQFCARSLKQIKLKPTRTLGHPFFQWKPIQPRQISPCNSMEKNFPFETRPSDFCSSSRSYLSGWHHATAISLQCPWGKVTHSRLSRHSRPLDALADGINIYQSLMILDPFSILPRFVPQPVLGRTNHPRDSLPATPSRSISA